MSYTPIGWQTGDTITAEKLNKCDNGWSVETTRSTVYNGSVTFSGSDVDLNLTTNDLSNTSGSEATITWNGTEYTCNCFDDSGYMTYGSSYNDYSAYPFSIYLNTDSTNTWYVATSAVGTYTVKIEAVSTTTEVSNDFQAAVQTAQPFQSPFFEVTIGSTTWQQVYDAMDSGRIPIIHSGFMIELGLYTDNVNGYHVHFMRVAGSSVSVRELYANSTDGTLYND